MQGASSSNVLELGSLFSDHFLQAIVGINELITFGFLVFQLFGHQVNMALVTI